MKPILVGTDLDRSGAASHSGFVDVIDQLRGVRGWAVNLMDPAEPVALQLCLGSRVVAEIVTSMERSDISAKLGQKAPAGFEFDSGVMLSLPDYIDDPDDPLVVRVAATGQLLPGSDKPPVAGELLASLQEAASAPAHAKGRDLQGRLDDLRGDAASLAEQKLQAAAEAMHGYLETLSAEPSGQIWFTGWMRRGDAQEFAAVVSDRRRFPAGVAVIFHERDDVPADACGAIGLIASSWRPGAAQGEILLFFGDRGQFHLRSHKPMRTLSWGELVGEYESVRHRCIDDGRSMALQSMLTAQESWLPAKTPAQNYGAETSIDRVLLVPGLGCLVEGWVVSPMKRIDALRLRVGQSVLSAHRESLFWKKRPDLLAAYPGGERIVGQAGFVGLFVGDAEPDDFAAPVLKVVFEDGSSANWTVAARIFRRLGHSAAVDEALQFFPALQDESFFPDFARAAIRAERSAMNAPVPISVARSRRVMVFVLPEERCDMFLLFEELAEQRRRGRSIEALAFIASSRSNRSDAMWLFREFQAAQGTPRGIACSLLVVDDAVQAFDLLPDILRELGASRFFFAGSGIFLKEAGWARAHQALAQGALDLVFFGLESDAFEHRAAADGVSARCFAWSTGQFARWALGAPAFMGGFFRDNALLRSPAAQTVHHNSARCTRTRFSTRIQEAVNETVYASHASAALQGAV